MLLAPDEVLAKLTELSIPKFADFSIVYRIAEDGRAHRVASAHVDESRRELIDELERSADPVVRTHGRVARMQLLMLTDPVAILPEAKAVSEEALTLYQFNTRVAQHFFCRHCGVATFNRTRKDPQYWRANIGCLDTVDAYALDYDVLNGALTSVVSDASTASRTTGLMKRGGSSAARTS